MQLTGHHQKVPTGYQSGTNLVLRPSLGGWELPWEQPGACRTPAARHLGNFIHQQLSITHIQIIIMDESCMRNIIITIEILRRKRMASFLLIFPSLTIHITLLAPLSYVQKAQTSFFSFKPVSSKDQTTLVSPALQTPVCGVPDHQEHKRNSRYYWFFNTRKTAGPDMVVL